MAPGATLGKSNKVLGVPFAKESALRTVVTNQFVGSLLAREYPHPTVEPGGPATAPLLGVRLKSSKSA
jgi:hypothetical protein